VTFTFPHIGNIGANDEDIEDLTPAARTGAVGVILKADITEPSNYRSAGILMRGSRHAASSACRASTPAH
jgi:carbamoyl-phosphate synthase small subunit